MKYIKSYEKQDKYKKYVIIKREKEDTVEIILINVISYSFFDDGNLINTRHIKKFINYKPDNPLNNYKYEQIHKTDIILYQTNNLKEAQTELKKINDFYLDINKYNL